MECGFPVAFRWTTGTDSPSRFQRIAGSCEWDAQLGMIAADTKIRKDGNGNPNDQCLAPIRFCTTDILSVAILSNPLAAGDRRSAASGSADFRLHGFQLQRRRTRCPSYIERSLPAGWPAGDRPSCPCDRLSSFVRRTSCPSRSCRIRWRPAIGRVGFGPNDQCLAPIRFQRVAGKSKGRSVPGTD